MLHYCLFTFVFTVFYTGKCDQATEDLVKQYEQNGWIETAETIKNHIGPFIEPTEFRHHNYTELLDYLFKYSQRYPHLTYLYSIGKSVQGRELPVITISLNPSYENPNVPDFKYVANMHGNEVTGRELTLMLVQVLLENYGKNEYLTRLVNTTSIHIMPTMNPDGYEMSTEGDMQGIKGRRNANMVDLNRDFPNRFYPSYKSPQPETLAVMNWTKRIPFVLSANLHDGTMLVNYPYDDGTNDKTVAHTPDHNLFVRLAYSYARSHAYMWKKGPRCLPDYGGEPRTGITNGAEWYPVSGGMQDWNYLNTDCFEITVEMNCQKFPYARDLPRIWNEHKYALIGYISQIHKSLSGIIRDRVSGRGIDGVEVQVREAGKIVHSRKGGAYFRLLNPGRYTVVFAHPNYEPMSFEFSTLQVPYKRLDVMMTPKAAQPAYTGNNANSSSSYFTSSLFPAVTITFANLPFSATSTSDAAAIAAISIITSSTTVDATITAATATTITVMPAVAVATTTTSITDASIANRHCSVVPLLVVLHIFVFFTFYYR